MGLPIVAEGIEPDQLHWGEVGLADGQLVTAGLYGWTAVVTGTGCDIATARGEAYTRAARVISPNLRYRLDIGDRLIAGDLDRLAAWGWLGATPPLTAT